MSGLLNNDTSTTTSAQGKFESVDDNAAATGATSAPAQAPAASPAPAATPASAPTAAPTAAPAASGLVSQTGGAVATKIPEATLKVVENLKDAMPVDYNTLSQIITTNGNFVERETKKVLGDAVVFELLSWQDAYVVSPEDEEAPKDAVRYSDDKITCTDGTPVDEHLKFLQDNGYPKAKVKQRVVVVGGLQSAAKTSDLNGTLVQFDLSPMSMVQWKRYRANVAYGLKIGKVTAEQAVRIKATTQLANSQGKDFTLAVFNVAD
jgi:hypothetical protein